jgi:hypothetical protein
MSESLVGRGIPPQVQFEITHDCNQNCLLCDHRIRYSDYAGMTRAQYRRVIACLDTAQFKVADMIGGEPLMHPEFHWFAEQMVGDFRQAMVRVRTNGRLIPRFLEECPDLFARLIWIVQEYPGFNDDVLPQIADLANVQIRPYQEFWDPYRDPDLGEALARKIRLGCIYHVRIVGDRLYNCCLAEGIERYYHTEPVHVVMSPNWREDWTRLETWRACQHCFRAIDWFDSEGQRKRRRSE